VRNDVSMPCECRRNEQRRKRTAQLLDHFREEAGALASCTLENFDTERSLSGNVEWDDGQFTPEQQRAALRHVHHLLSEYVQQPGDWCYLAGPYGSGKSHLAAAVANALAYQEWTVSYASLPELLAFIRTGFKDGSSEQRLNALKGADFLVLDDVGTEMLTDWSEETLFRIVNQRYLHNRATFFTSNMRLDDLDQPRLASRIRGKAIGDDGEVLLVAGDCRRKRGKR
jgi:DNA replication protein DnaC